MMATTHVFTGLAVVAPVAYVAPISRSRWRSVRSSAGSPPISTSSVRIGGRYTFPSPGSPSPSPAVVLAAVSPSILTLALAAFVVTAWLHAASDSIGGGPEMDPWNDRTERAVYDHVRGRWIRPRRWIRYDGCPEDAVLGVALAIPALVVFDGWLTAVITGCVTVSLVYALLRRRLVAWTPDWLE